MPRKGALKLKCPICKKPVRAIEPDFPFCSERCRLIDLGNWASGKYVVPSPLSDTAEEAKENAIPDPNKPE